MARQSATVPLLTAALILSGVAASAQPEIDFSRAGRDRVVCVRKPAARPLSGKWRPSETIYSCTKNGVTFETNQLPYSRDREMRGIGW